MGRNLKTNRKTPKRNQTLDVERQTHKEGKKAACPPAESRDAGVADYGTT